MRYKTTIKFLDEDSPEEVITKIGDIGDDDDEIFFYFESEKDLLAFFQPGVEDFVVLSYEKIGD